MSVQCVVTKGDSPLEISWTFDGRPIQSYHSDVIVSDSTKRVKQLTIESVAARHAGEYTCVASNVAGSTSHSATLDVNGTHTSGQACSRFAFPLAVLRLNYPTSCLLLAISRTIYLSGPIYIFSFSFTYFFFLHPSLRFTCATEICDASPRFLYYSCRTTCVCVL